MFLAGEELGTVHINNGWVWSMYVRKMCWDPT